MAATSLIALSGRAGSGKSTVADVLVNEAGFVRVKFASALKAMLTALYETAGFAQEEIDDRLEGHLKERPCAVLGGQTPRFAMQTLGTEWGRSVISPSLWTNITRATIRANLNAGQSVVVDDLRFPNELALIEDMGGETATIVRGLGDEFTDHISESGGLKTLYTIPNNRSKDELQELTRHFFGVPFHFRDNPD